MFVNPYILCDFVVSVSCVGEWGGKTNNLPWRGWAGLSQLQQQSVVTVKITLPGHVHP